MVLLESRESLTDSSAELFTNPGFLALCTLQTKDGSYLPLEARVSGRRDFTVTLKHSAKDDPSGQHISFHYVQGEESYSGRLSVNEETGRPQVHLKRVKNKKVTSRFNRKKKKIYGYKNDDKQFVELKRSELKHMQYGVIDTMKHIGQHVDDFLQVVGAEQYQNGYHELDKKFKLPYTRNLKEFSVYVTGTYVGVDWSKYSTKEVVRSIKRTARKINHDHFFNDLLPKISGAGHDVLTLIGTYNVHRDLGSTNNLFNSEDSLPR